MHYRDITSFGAWRIVKDFDVGDITYESCAN